MSGACRAVRSRIFSNGSARRKLREARRGRARGSGFGLGRLLGHVGIVVDAHQGAAARGDGLLARGAGFRQRLVDGAGGQRLGVAAFGLHLLEQLPGVARPARRSAPRCSRIRRPDRPPRPGALPRCRTRCTFSARCGSKPNGSTVSGSQPPMTARHGLGGDAQQVGVAVVDALVEPRACARAGACGRRRRLADRRRPRPAPTACAPRAAWRFRRSSWSRRRRRTRSARPLVSTGTVAVSAARRSTPVGDAHSPVPGRRARRLRAGGRRESALGPGLAFCAISQALAACRARRGTGRARCATGLPGRRELPRR